MIDLITRLSQPRAKADDINTFAKVLAIFALLMVLAGCIPSQNASPQADKPSGELASVLQNGILVIASDPAYPPQSNFNRAEPRLANTRCNMSQYTTNQWTGFDVDVAIEIARRLGVEPCFVAHPWTQIVAGGWNGLWDINVGSMVITPERMKNLYFTQPYISGEAVIFVHRDNQTYHQPGDLSGKRIGVCTGCAYEAYLHGTLTIPGEKIENVIRNPVVVGYDTDTSALADLALGDGAHLDAVMTDPDTGNQAIRSGLPIKQLADVVYHDYSGVALDKNSNLDPIPLVRKITEIIQAMHRDGTLLKLSQKYYGGDFTSPAARFNFNTLNQYP